MDCANSIVLIEARFQFGPAESDYFWTNTLSMCASNGPLPNVWGPAHHVGSSSCGQSNDWGEQDIHFKIPLKEPSPSALLKKSEIMVSVETPQVKNAQDFDEIFQQKIQRTNLMIGRERKVVSQK